MSAPLLALVLVPAALVTSTISGILGMGGGITLLGVMTTVLAPRAIVPLHGVVQLVSNFTRTVAFLRRVRWTIFAVYLPPYLLGIFGARALWLWLDQAEKLTYLQPVIGAFILFFLYWRRHKPALRHLPLAIYVPVGAVAGFLSIFVGATGPFLAPFFLRDDLDKEEVIATKAACQAVGHALKIPTFLSMGFDYTPHLPLLGALAAAVVVGTMLGKKLLGQLKNDTFVRAFEAVLGGMGVFLIVRWLVRTLSA